MSADIIRFPARTAAIPGDEAQERLRRAIAGLDAALATQRTAVAEWREALGRLRTTMAGLGDSVLRCRDSLDHVGSRVGAVNAQARALESWADSALAVAADPA